MNNALMRRHEQEAEAVDVDAISEALYSGGGWGGIDKAKRHEEESGAVDVDAISEALYSGGGWGGIDKN